MRLASMKALPFFVLTLFPALARAEGVSSERKYQLLRDGENWAWLRHGTDTHDEWDALKYVRPFARDDLYLTLGGEMRQWVEGYSNELWGKSNVGTNVYWLQRYMLHLDTHITPYARLFAQLKSGVEVGRIGGPRPVDRDDLDFNQLYGDLVAIPGEDLDKKPVLLARVGRQEMSYGSGRLIDVREGPTVRFGYDGVRIMSRSGPLRFDTFAVRPQLTNPGAFDDTTDKHQAFWGTWGTLELPAILVDAYYLGVERDNFKYQKVAGKEWRHTAGARVRAILGPAECEVEAAYQFGAVATTPISAWTFAAQAVFRSPATLFKPILTLGFGATSGDGGRTRAALGTFNALFPRGAYFGLVAANGPENDLSPHAAFALELPAGFALSGEAWAFWRESLNDGVYSVPGFLLRSGATNQGRYLGSQIEGYLSWQADRHVSINATLAYFGAGGFFDTSLPGRDITYAAGWATYKF